MDVIDWNSALYCYVQSRRRHTRCLSDWSSDVCSSDLLYGGMSGGPVFDARGGLFGIASRSPELGAGEEPSPMIAALLWPALGTRFPMVMVEAETRTSLLELHGKYLSIERPEAVKVEAADGRGEEPG